MKGFALFGIVLVLLGLLTLAVPFPRSERHGVKIGDAQVGIQTETREKLPPAVGLALLVSGVVALAIGLRKS